MTRIIFSRGLARNIGYIALLGMSSLGGQAAFLAPAWADSQNVVYHGHDLGLALAAAIVQVQATGGSAAPHVDLSISGSGEQFMFTEVNFDMIETETTSYKNLEYDGVDVRKIGQAEGRYGITLHAAAGSVNDHIVGISASKAKLPDRDSALDYMDFWLVDADTSRVRHLADLFATIGARLKEQAPAATAMVADNTDKGGDAEPAPQGVAKHLLKVTPASFPAGHIEAQTGTDEPDDATPPLVQRAPRAEVVTDDGKPVDSAEAAPADAARKCLFSSGPKRRKHGKGASSPALWSPMKTGMTGGQGRISYRLSALHGAAAHQSIEFYLSNLSQVPAVVVGRVILTASDGSQKAEEIGLDEVSAHGTTTDASLKLEPFDENTCITDVDVTEIHACPLPDENAAGDDTVDVYHCNEEAAAGTVTIGGITYVKGREPKMLSIADASAKVPGVKP